MYNKKRKEKNIMGKSRNEVNGVLVYRRWCAGAILSAIVLLLVIAVPVLAIIYNWIVITVPEGSSVYEAGTITLTGLDLLKPILGKEFAAQGLINAIASGSTAVKYFGVIMKYALYGMFGFLALIALFGVIEVIFFIFYVLAGRVVSPSAPVKLSWVLFALTFVFGGLTFGLSALVANAYASAAGETFNFLQFLLAGILPTFITTSVPAGFVMNFFWPLVYIAASLFGAIIISIIYSAAFKDKFYIGRAKRFGSGEPATTERYETTHIYTNGTQTSATNSGQPQVIVVNSGQTPANNTPVIAYPGQPQPLVIQTTSGPAVVPQPAPAPVQEDGDLIATPASVLPSDMKSIGGHAFSKNLDLKYADIPSGIKELGVGAFANCLNLEVVSIPKSVKRIKKNCFFNCAKLARINYEGTKSEWRYIVRGSNWLDKAGTKTVVCSDGAIIVDPHR